MSVCRECGKELFWGTKSDGGKIPMDKIHGFMGRDKEHPFGNEDFPVIRVTVYRPHQCKAETKGA